MHKRCLAFIVTLLAAGVLGESGCGLYALQSSDGGGQTAFNPPRVVHPADIALPERYRIEPIVAGLTFPTDVDFDAAGRVYVTEAGYSYGKIWTKPRLLRIGPKGQKTTIAIGGRNVPGQVWRYMMASSTSPKAANSKAAEFCASLKMTKSRRWWKVCRRWAIITPTAPP
jgi:hypothetical protein